MAEVLTSLATVLVMAPVMVVVLLGVIYGFGEVFNIISRMGHKDS